MIRRGKKERPRPEASAPVPPSRPPTPDEAARTLEQPVVPGSDEPEPSAQVLDELLSFFGVRHGEPRHRPPSPPRSAPPDVPPDSSLPDSSLSDSSLSDSSLSDSSLSDSSLPDSSLPAVSPRSSPPDAPRRAAPPDAPPTAPPPAPSASPPPSTAPAPAPAADPPAVAADAPAVPAAGVAGSPTEFGLVRAPTKRQTRRSAREAKREEKAERKRLAQLAKKRKKAAKKAAKKAGKHGAGTGDEGDEAASGPVDSREGVRIITAGAAASTATPDAPAGASPGSAPAAPAPDGSPPRATTGAAEERATISIGGEDDLPDAVYLEGSLDEGGPGERSTVFIDDKDPATGAMVSIEVATTANRMEPRLRDRRIAVRRAVGRKRLKWIALATFVVGAIVAALAVMGSGLFAVNDIRVEGAVYSVGPELDAVVADLDGQNVLRIDTGGIEEELRRIPWVADARVTTDFPHGVTIELRERVPVLAYLGPDQKYRVLDSGGRVITVLDGRPTDYLELMVDTGQAPNLAPGALAPEGYRAAATLVTALVDPLRPMVESLSVDPAGTDLQMQLVNGVEVRFGAAEALQDKLVRLTVALIETDPDKAATTMIDVSTPDIVTR